MAAKRDYYEVLDLNRSDYVGKDIGNPDTDGTLANTMKRAFRKLARQYHPDVNKDKGAEARFKEVNEAWEILGDSAKREIYDSYPNSASYFAASEAIGGAIPRKWTAVSFAYAPFNGNGTPPPQGRGPFYGNGYTSPSSAYETSINGGALAGAAAAMAVTVAAGTWANKVRKDALQESVEKREKPKSPVFATVLSVTAAIALGTSLVLLNNIVRNR